MTTPRTADRGQQVTVSTTNKVATKTARLQRITEILEHHDVASQAQLLELLATAGFDVTQATLSRDLDELRAVKVRSADGGSVYAIPQDGGDPSPVRTGADSGLARLERIVGELLSSVDSSANIVILRTPPGAAQYLASVIDHSILPAIIGTVAGDDTVLVVTKDPDGGRDVAHQFATMTNRRGTVTVTDLPTAVQPRTESAETSAPVKENK